MTTYGKWTFASHGGLYYVLRVFPDAPPEILLDDNGAVRSFRGEADARRVAIQLDAAEPVQRTRIDPPKPQA